MSDPIKILIQNIQYSISLINQKYNIAIGNVQYNIAIDHVTIADPPPNGIGLMVIESTFIIG